MKNLETPVKTGRVGRYAVIKVCGIQKSKDLFHHLLLLLWHLFLTAPTPKCISRIIKTIIPPGLQAR